MKSIIVIIISLLGVVISASAKSFDLVRESITDVPAYKVGDSNSIGGDVVHGHMHLTYSNPDWASFVSSIKARMMAHSSEQGWHVDVGSSGESLAQKTDYCVFKMKKGSESISIVLYYLSAPEKSAFLVYYQSPTPSSAK